MCENIQSNDSIYKIILWVNSLTDFNLGMVTALGEGKLWTETCSTLIKKLTLCHFMLLQRDGWTHIWNSSITKKKW